MNIPKKIKIGGVPYKVTITENVKMGDDYAAEIRYQQQEINIRPAAPEVSEISFWHECVHGMMKALGLSEHDEKLVDGLAFQLHLLVKDNPRLFER